MVDGGVYTRRDPKEKARVRKMAREWNRQAAERERLALQSPPAKVEG